VGDTVTIPAALLVKQTYLIFSEVSHPLSDDTLKRVARCFINRERPRCERGLSYLMRMEFLQALLA
jgi:hypothetical protein